MLELIYGLSAQEAYVANIVSEQSTLDHARKRLNMVGIPSWKSVD
jgi:hypothetical protein